MPISDKMLLKRLQRTDNINALLKQYKQTNNTNWALQQYNKLSSKLKHTKTPQDKDKT